MVSIKVSERNGKVVGAVQVAEEDEIMLISDAGTLVRTRAAEVSTVGRNTQGVTLIRTAQNEHVVGLQRIDEIEGVAELDEESGDAQNDTSDNNNNTMTEPENTTDNNSEE